MVLDHNDSSTSHIILSRSPSANTLRNTHIPPIPSYIPLPDSPALSASEGQDGLPMSESMDSLAGPETPTTPFTALAPPIVAVITPSNEIVDPMNEAPMQQLIEYVQTSLNTYLKSAADEKAMLETRRFLNVTLSSSSLCRLQICRKPIIHCGPS